MRNLLIFIYIPILVSSIISQTEFFVNSYKDSTQRDPQIACDAEGKYAIIWNSEDQTGVDSKGDIFLQLFDSDDNKIGDEMLVNTTTAGDQEKPAIAMNSAGDFIVAWASYSHIDSIYDIKARIYKNNIAQGNEIIVNSSTEHSQTNPDIAIKEDGESVVVWDSWFQDGSDRGVFAQRIDAGGIKIGNEFQVNSEIDSSQARPAVKYLPDAGFIVTWESWNQDHTDPSGYGLYGQMFDSGGLKVGDEFQINTYTNNYQWYSDIEVFEDTTFAVVWCSWEQDGDDGGIYLQRFDKNTEKTGEEFQVNTHTANYQWLPRIIKLTDKNFAVVWSSWKQDGSREGIIARFFDEAGGRVSLEVQVNDYTDSFQWEPDAIMTGENELLVVWSSWGELDKDYEIKAKRISPMFTQGILDPSTYQHANGKSTADFMVHVVDSTALTGDVYEISFQLISSDSALVDITNSNTQQIVIEDFEIFESEGFLFLTPLFDGIRVEIFPEFDFEIDQENSRFINPSGSTLMFSTTLSSVGTQNLAPIDVALIWGNTDTLANGMYSNPLDTVMGIDALIDIFVPFKGWNLTDNEQVDLIVVDEDVLINNRWDPEERIVFFTPQQYQNTSFDTHIGINSELPAGNLIMPAAGDSNLIYTTHPLSNEDIFTFQTSSSFIVGIGDNHQAIPDRLQLFQNYPNPFNPRTKIEFYIPHKERVKITLYNVLGQKVTTILDGVRDQGFHRVIFDGSKFATGIYFYILKYQDQQISRKMLLIK